MENIVLSTRNTNVRPKQKIVQLPKTAIFRRKSFNGYEELEDMYEDIGQRVGGDFNTFSNRYD